MSASEIPKAQPIRPDAQAGSERVIDDTSSDTESLRSSLLHSLRENGRGYHKYRSDMDYILPEDKREQDRLDLQHGLFMHSFSQRLYLAPIGDDTRDVLDLGTGTGIWAIDFADQHPNAKVLGIDLSPIQPRWLPPNCKFELDDFESEWLYSHDFDFIHARMLSPVCKDFHTLFQRSFNQLKPGGWLEMQDVYMPVMCDDGTLDGTDFQQWSALFVEASMKLGKDPRWPAKYKEWMIDAGFEGVTEKIFKWPINPWPKDARMKEIGDWSLVNMLDGLEGFTFRLFTKVLGWTTAEVEVFLVGVRKDLQNRKIHSYWRIHVVYGQKPKARST